MLDEEVIAFDDGSLILVVVGQAYNEIGVVSLS